LCKKWKFPIEVTRAVRRHHALTPIQDNELAYILHTADNLTRLNGNGCGGGGRPHPIDDQMLDFLAMDEKDLMHIMVEVNESIYQISAEIFSTA